MRAIFVPADFPRASLGRLDWTLAFYAEDTILKKIAMLGYVGAIEYPLRYVLLLARDAGYSPNALTRNTAICARVTGSSGQ